MRSDLTWPDEAGSSVTPSSYCTVTWFSIIQVARNLAVAEHWDTAHGRTICLECRGSRALGWSTLSQE